MDKKYYTEVKKDILPSQSSISIEKWTDWRKLNYDFYKKFDYNGKKVVNLGAGKGYFRELFKDSDYLTVDFYPYEGIDVVVDLIQPLPFDSNHYDFIIHNFLCLLNYSLKSNATIYEKLLVAFATVIPFEVCRSEVVQHDGFLYGRSLKSRFL